MGSARGGSLPLGSVAKLCPPASSSPGAISHLMNVPGNGGEDLLLVGSEACVLLDGQELAPRWTFGVAQVLRYGVCSRNACGCCRLGPSSPPLQQPWGQGPHWRGDRAGMLLRGASCLPPGAAPH